MLNQKELAAALGVTERSVRRWVDEGMPTVGEGRAAVYDEGPCRAWCVRRGKVLGGRGRASSAPASPPSTPVPSPPAGGSAAQPSSSPPGDRLEEQPHGGALRRPGRADAPPVPEGLEQEIKSADTVAALALVGRRVTAEILRGDIEPRVGDLVIAGLREQRQAMRMRMLERQERAVAAIEVLSPGELAAIEAYRATIRPRPLDAGEAVLPPGSPAPAPPPAPA